MFFGIVSGAVREISPHLAHGHSIAGAAVSATMSIQLLQWLP